MIKSATYELDQYEIPIFHMIINGHDAYVPMDRSRFFYEYNVVPLDSFDENWDWNAVLQKIHVKTIGGISGREVEVDVSGCTDDEKICALTEEFFKNACRDECPKKIDLN